MFSFKLTSKIAISLLFFFLVTMFIVYFIMVIATQKTMMRSELQKSEILKSAIEKSFELSLHVSEPDSKNDKGIGTHFDGRLSNVFIDKTKEMLHQNEYKCGFLMDRKGQKIYLRGSSCPTEKELYDITAQSILTGKSDKHLMGSTWGVFWKQYKYLAVSIPLKIKMNTIGGITVILPLDNIYSALRQRQRIILYYILINAIIFTMIGTYHFYTIITKPLQRLFKRANQYAYDDDLFMLSTTNNNEFSKISSTMNQMLQRIIADKAELKQTVESLGKANLKIKHTQNELVRAEKLATVGRLSSGVAHEIGNPVGIVLGYLELLKQDLLTPEEKMECINRSEQEINRINVIIRQLLDFARPSDIEKENFNVHDLIEDVVTSFKLQPQHNKITFDLSLHAETGIIFGDKNLLRQVFLNLLINAADAISSKPVEENPLIEIKTVNVIEESNNISRQFLKIKFKDNGYGISKEYIENIFDPFYTTKEPGRGTGLGLSISFKIIEALGGSLHAESNTGKGATMIISLPVSEDNNFE